ncbi:hypothetical protein ACO0QE_001278 [Hanseniaspora vineae]
MSITAIIWFSIYVGIFAMTSLISLTFIVPMMSISFICAGLIILIGMFSNMAFRSAQKVYEWNIAILQSLLVKLAEKMPPAHQSREGDATKLQANNKNSSSALKSVEWVKTKVTHVSERVQNKLVSIIHTFVDLFTNAVLFLHPKDKSEIANPKKPATPMAIQVIN